MRLHLPIALRSPAYAVRGLEALEPLWAGAHVTGLKPLPLRRPSGNKDRAREIYAGIFALEGQMLECRGRSIFVAPPPSAQFAESLHGFGWLADLEASGRALDRAHARALVADWLNRTRAKPPAARLLSVRASRLQNWVKSAPFLLEGASESFTAEFCKGLTAEIRWMLLPRWTAADRSAATLALAHAVAGLSGLDALAKTAARRLGAELSRAFPSGMPPSRNGAELAETLHALADLRPEFPAVLAPLEQALAHLTLSDGSLARFQGAHGDVSSVASVPDAAQAVAGFVRLAQGETTLVLDAGRAVSAASLLAFELTSGPERIVTGCGWPASGALRWRQAAQRLAAHSAPCLGAQDPAPVSAQSECGLAPQGAYCVATHAGWPGFTAERRLFLAADGRNLRGEDALTANSANADAGPFTLRFHLSPGTDARLAEDGGSVLLAAGVQIWSFTAKGAALGLEDSISFAGLSTPVAAKQLTLTVEDTQGGTAIKWAFRRVA